MTVTGVGSTISGSGAGVGTTTTASVTPASIHNLLVAASEVNSASLTATVSGGGAVDWQRIGAVYNDTFFLTNFEIWCGRVVTPGAATVTWTWSGSVAGTNYGTWLREFTSDVPVVWDADVSAGQTNGVTGTTVTFPTLAPTIGVPSLYVGAMYHTGTGTAGSTTGFTYNVNVAAGSLAFNPNVAASVAPTMTQVSGQSAGIAALIRAVPLVTPTQPYTARRRAANF